jgi:hypothetical protein
MRYLLVVGFFCRVYRQEPRARLFLNDQLIDEFNIQHHTENNDLERLLQENKHQLDPSHNKRTPEYYRKLLPCLRFYQIDVDDQLKQSQIVIDIDNNDCDYTNGFMRRSTLLQLRILSLLPEDKKIYSWFLQRMRDRRNTDRYPWYRREGINRLFSLDNVTWIGNNGQNFHNKPKIHAMKNFNIGGNGRLHCEIIKKYGIWSTKFQDHHMRSYTHFVDNPTLDAIYNKYEQHENQRNTD